MLCSCCETPKNNQTSKDIHPQTYIFKLPVSGCVLWYKCWYVLCECLLWSSSHTYTKSNNLYLFCTKWIKSAEISQHQQPDKGTITAETRSFSLCLSLNRITSHHFWRAVVLFILSWMQNPAEAVRWWLCRSLPPPHRKKEEAQILIIAHMHTYTEQINQLQSVKQAYLFSNHGRSALDRGNNKLLREEERRDGYFLLQMKEGLKTPRETVYRHTHTHTLPEITPLHYIVRAGGIFIHCSGCRRVWIITVFNYICITKTVSGDNNNNNNNMKTHSNNCCA